MVKMNYSTVSDYIFCLNRYLEKMCGVCRKDKILIESVTDKLTVMSRQWQVLERVTATQIISSQPKTHPQARPKRRTLQDTSVK